MATDIVWLRDDFRLDDQPALAAASDGPALCVYVHDQRPQNGRPLGGAAKWRLAQSLASLERDLAGLGGRLDVVAGDASRTILALATAAGARRVLWSRRYERDAIALDAGAEAALKTRGIEAASFNGRLMREPRELMKADGRPSGAFSAFWRRHRGLGALPAPLAAPPRLASAPWPPGAPPPTTIAALKLTPTAPDWAAELALGETPGEEGARAALARFVAGALPDYVDGRDGLARDATSRLSASLRFGEVSPRRAAVAVEAAAAATHASRAPPTSTSRSSAGAIFPTPCWPPSRSRDAPAAAGVRALRVPGRRGGLQRLGQGRTGYPVVDAGMRQLWRTGYMQNRVRMIAASFLVKHLLIDWRRGEEWFWDTLCDADPASNPASWQWVTGSGVDAAPFFRISIPSCRARGSTPTALSSDAGSRSWRASRRRTSTRRGARRRLRSPAPTSRSERPTRIPLSTTTPRDRGRSPRLGPCAPESAGARGPRLGLAPPPAAFGRSETITALSSMNAGGGQKFTLYTEMNMRCDNISQSDARFFG